MPASFAAMPISFRARLAIVLLAILAPLATAQTSSDLAGALFGGPQQDADPGQRIDMAEFPDADITDILKIVSDNSGWSIFASKSAKVKVSLTAKNITARELLDRAVAAGGLVYRQDKNVINVMTFDEYAEAFGLAKKVIPLRHASAANVVQVITPFLTRNGKVAVQETGNRLILLDSKASLAELERVVTALDEPSAVAQVEIVTLVHRDAAELVNLVSQYAGPATGGASRQAAPAASAQRQPGSPARSFDGIPRVVSAPFALFADVRTNAILLVGAAEDRKIIKEIITALDAIEVRTIKTYPVRNTDAQEVFEALENLQASQRANSQEDRGRKVALSRQTNAVTVFGTPADHAQAESLVTSMDIPIPEGPGRVHVYMLENTKADEMADLLASLTGGENATPGGRNFQSRLGSTDVTGITTVPTPAYAGQMPAGSWPGATAAHPAPPGTVLLAAAGCLRAAQPVRRRASREVLLVAPVPRREQPANLPAPAPPCCSGPASPPTATPIPSWSGPRQPTSSPSSRSSASSTVVAHKCSSRQYLWS